MRVEAWIFGALTIFFAVVTPIYFFLSHEPTGTAALIMTGLLVLIVLGPIFGWWLMIVGFGLSFITLTGLLYEFYRGDHAH